MSSKIYSNYIYIYEQESLRVIYNSENDKLQNTTLKNKEDLNNEFIIFLKITL